MERASGGCASGGASLLPRRAERSPTSPAIIVAMNCESIRDADKACGPSWEQVGARAPAEISRAGRINYIAVVRDAPSSSRRLRRVSRARGLKQAGPAWVALSRAVPLARLSPRRRAIVVRGEGRSRVLFIRHRTCRMLRCRKC